MKTVLRVIVLLIVFAYPVWSIDETATGFYYPTGTSNLGTYAGWLASGCGTNTAYFDDEYHIGWDIQGNQGDPVYPISDGTVEYISYNGWGSGNVGVFIKHKLSDGSYFLALYGHIQISVSVGDMVFAGKSFGTIGSWSFGDHVHFGVVPGANIPPSPWGRMDCSNWPSTNSFVDPINWITTQTPYANVGHYADGWHANGTSQAILDRFIQSANNDNPLGEPINNNNGGFYVHDWYSITLQDFYGNNGFDHPHTAVILNPSGTAAHLLKEGFWDYYMNHEGYRNLGAPTGEEDPNYFYSRTGYVVTRQTFEFGWIIYDDPDPNDGIPGTVYPTDLNGNPIPTQPATFTPNPPTAEVWHNGEKQGEGTVTIALYEGFTYEYDIKEDGYDVGTQSITVPSSTSEVNPDLTPGTGANNPANFPLTIEAEDMYGVGIPVAGGVKLTSPDVPQHWYAIASLNLPQAGWIEAEVVAYAEGQVGGEWPKMLTGLQVRVSMLNYI